MTSHVTLAFGRAGSKLSGVLLDVRLRSANPSILCASTRTILAQG